MTLRTLFAAACFAAPAALAQDKGEILMADQILKTNEYLVSAHRDHFAILQPDGNFCVHRGTRPGASKGAVWCSGKAPGPGDYVAVMQRDANFCVYRSASAGKEQDAVWCAGTTAQESDRYYLWVDGSRLRIWESPARVAVLVTPRVIWESPR